MARKLILIIQIICSVQCSHSFSSTNPFWKHLQFTQQSFSHDTSNNDSITLHATTNHNTNQNDKTRRSFLTTIQSLPLICTPAAKARGLARFPAQSLQNTYHFLRSGTTLLEEENVISTNPLFLTNREAALSEAGMREVRDACRLLSERGVNPTVVRYSLAAGSVDSANIVGEELKIGRDRLVPEFNYMDPRAIGAWDFAALNETMEAVWAMDEKEAGPSGKGGRPPPNEDGTPAETLSDQVVRLTNLVSVLETLYSGDSILLIFPDGTGPALLSCLIGGIPLNRVHEFNYQPGEVRCSVDYDSVTAMALQQPPQSYFDIMNRGRVKLQYLREHPDEQRNVKDLKFEEEQKAEAERQRKADAKLKKETEMELKKEKQVKDVKEYNSSFGPEVGLGAAVLIVGGIAGASFLSPSDDANSTQIETSNVQNLNNDSNQPEEEEVFSTDVSDEDLDMFIKATSMTQPTDRPGIGFKEGNPIDLKGKKAMEVNTSAQSEPIDLDYDESWLGAITDIMNEDEMSKDGKL